MKDKISVRQICFIMIAYTVANKVLVLPTQLALTAKQDLLFSLLLPQLLSLLSVWAVAYFASRNHGTLYDFLQSKIGKWGARVIFTLLIIYLFTFSLMPIAEQKLYMHTIFYDTIPSLVVFLPFFIFSTYACLRGYQNIGRMADLLLPIFAIIMVLMLAMSMGSCKLQNLLPILQTPFTKIVGGSRIAYGVFKEPILLLFFLGRFSYQKGDTCKITVSYGVGCAILLLIVAVFYSIYGSIAGNQTFAISKLTLFFSAVNSVGRADLVLLYALELVMLFSVLLPLQLCCLGMCQAYHIQKSWVVSLVVNVLLLVLTVILDTNFHNLEKIFGAWGFIATAVFAVLLPLFLWCIGGRRAQ